MRNLKFDHDYDHDQNPGIGRMERKRLSRFKLKVFLALSALSAPISSLEKDSRNRGPSRLLSCLIMVLAGLAVQTPVRAELLTDAGAFAWSSAGVRPLGMGGAFTAMADDANSVFSNPAGAALSPTRQMFYTQADLFNLKIVKQQQAAAVLPSTPKFPAAVGLGFSSLRVDFDPDSWTETVLAMAFARKVLPFKEDSNLVVKKSVRVYAGLTGKYLSVNSNFAPATEISQSSVVTVSVDGGKAKGYSVDAGFLVTSGERWRAGLAILDAVSLITWDTKTTESLARRLRLGVAGSPLKGLTVSAEPELSKQSGKMAVDRASGGLELRLNELIPKGIRLGKVSDISLRGGISRDLGDNAGGEMGGGLSIFFKNFSLDYALVSRQGVLGLTHRWGFGTSL